MGRGKQLTQSEKEKIDLLRRVNPDWTHKKIGEAIGRSQQVISKYLADPENHGKGQRSGRPRVTTKTDDRNIVRTAKNGKQTVAQVVSTLKLDCSISTAWRRLVSEPNTRYSKHASKPPLTPAHREARLKFATEFVSLPASEWDKIIWSDEKKWNLDGPDGVRYFWYDLRSEKSIFSKRQQGGGGVMIWAGFSAAGSTEIAFCKGRMNSEAHQRILADYLLPVAVEIAGTDYRFQQDNAAIHRSRSTKAWLDDNGVKVLTWPARSPDLNPIENLWGWMTKRVFANGRQFETVKDLKSAVVECWTEVSDDFRKSLVASMKDRMIQVIQKNGGSIDF